MYKRQFPLTRAIVGTTVGTKATIVPLVVAAFPFVARLVAVSYTHLDVYKRQVQQIAQQNAYQRDQRGGADLLEAAGHLVPPAPQQLSLIHI